MGPVTLLVVGRAGVWEKTNKTAEIAILTKFAVNMHIGDTLLSGHYTSACKNANDGLWRYFSDNRVQTMYATITNEFLLKSAQGGTPYTLFYKGNPFNCLNASIEFNRMFQNRIY